MAQYQSNFGKQFPPGLPFLATHRICEPHFWLNLLNPVVMLVLFAYYKAT
jgi:hypothetical protein